MRTALRKCCSSRINHYCYIHNTLTVNLSLLRQWRKNLISVRWFSNETWERRGWEWGIMVLFYMYMTEIVSFFRLYALHNYWSKKKGQVSLWLINRKNDFQMAHLLINVFKKIPILVSTFHGVELRLFQRCLWSDHVSNWARSFPIPN